MRCFTYDSHRSLVSTQVDAMLSHSSLTSLSTTCYQHLSLSDLLKGNLLARMQFLVQLGDWQNVLLPVLLSALKEVGDTCLKVGDRLSIL